MVDPTGVVASCTGTVSVTAPARWNVNVIRTLLPVCRMLVRPSNINTWVDTGAPNALQ